MAETAEGIAWQAKKLRELRDEWHRAERASRGEEEYTRILGARAAAIQALCNRADPLVIEARTRGFVYFRTMRDLGSRPDAIRLQFADGKGSFYERSLGIERIASKVGLPRAWYRELEPALHSYVRSLDGIRMLASGMQIKRVRANLV